MGLTWQTLQWQLAQRAVTIVLKDALTLTSGQVKQGATNSTVLVASLVGVAMVLLVAAAIIAVVMLLLRHKVRRKHFSSPITAHASRSTATGTGASESGISISLDS